MPFFKVFKSTVMWASWVCSLGVAQWATAMPRPIPEKPATSAVIALDTVELKWIAEHPQVIVASAQLPRYLFRDEQGQWVGLNNDLLNRISAMTGLKFVHEESFSTDHLLSRLESATADMSTTLAFSEERKVSLDFSHSYGGAGWVFVGQSGAPPVQSLEQLSNRVLVLPIRHALDATIRRDHPDIVLRSVRTYAEARALVESGEACATIENEIGAHLYPSGRLQAGSTLEGKWDPDHLTVRKGQPQLLSILNKALEAFPPAQLRAIRVKWLSDVAPKQTSVTSQPLILWFWVGVLILGLFGGLSLLWNRRLAVLVQQHRDAKKNLTDQLVFQHALMDAMPDPLFVQDLEGRLIMCNKSFEERLSTRFDQVRGRPLIELDVMPSATAKLLHAEFMAQLKTRKPHFNERQLLLHSGVVTVYQWTVPFYGEDGRLGGLVGGWSDFGERGRPF